MRFFEFACAVAGSVQGIIADLHYRCWHKCRQSTDLIALGSADKIGGELSEMPEVPRSLRVGAIVSVTAQSFVALPCQTRVLPFMTLASTPK